MVVPFMAHTGCFCMLNMLIFSHAKKRGYFNAQGGRVNFGRCRLIIDRVRMRRVLYSPGGALVVRGNWPTMAVNNELPEPVNKLWNRCRYELCKSTKSRLVLRVCIEWPSWRQSWMYNFFFLFCLSNSYAIMLPFVLRLLPPSPIIDHSSIRGRPVNQYELS